MTLKDVYTAAAQRRPDTEILIYMDRPADIYWIDNQPSALVSGYFTAVLQEDKDTLILVAGEKAG